MERNNGAYEGCGASPITWTAKPSTDNRATKHDQVRAGDAHAALVLDADGLAQAGASFNASTRPVLPIEPERPTERWRLLLRSVSSDDIPANT